jgi:hypothetical protein
VREDAVRGYRLVGRGESDQVAAALTRLILVFLAAAVTHVRNKEESGSPRETLRDAARHRWCVAYRTPASASPPVAQAGLLDDPCERAVPDTTYVRLGHVLIDGLIGTISIISRVWVLSSVAPLLRDDGSDAVLWYEVAACCASGVHFLLRHATVVDVPAIFARARARTGPSGAGGPTILHGHATRQLGGSMALVDVALAILVSFHQHARSSAASFAGVGRLLAVALVSLTCCNVCVFGCTACVVRATSLDSEFSSFVFPLSAVCWAVQVLTIGHQTTSLFAQPFVYLTSRRTAGRTDLSVVNIALCVILLGCPLQNKIVQTVRRKS